MASADNPLKKRKLYEPYPNHPLPLPPPQLQLQPHPPHHLIPQHPRPIHPSFAPPPPAPPPSISPDEILRRRRNRDEIRIMYESYRRIKLAVAKKDPRLMADLEQAYLALIKASRGCSSVQRVVAELIPRYASCCPTALEAAAKVSINMYSWSLAIIMRGEDVDGVAYQTAKACIFGLVDICSTASNEAPTSSVIQGICAAVFQNVLTFFASTFEGKDIYRLSSEEILKLQGPAESFCDLKQENADDNEPILHRLFKFRALSLLRIFFSCPKNILAACFELLSSGIDAVLYKRGEYFLRQVTSRLDANDVPEALSRKGDETSLSTDSTHILTDSKGMNELNPKSNDTDVSEKAFLLLKDCFMGMVIRKDRSLKGWVLSRYKKLCESLSSQDVPEVSSILEKIFGSLSEMDNEAVDEDDEENTSDSSKYISSSYLTHKTPLRHCNVDTSGRNHSSVADTLPEGNSASEDLGRSVKPHWSATSSEVDIHSVNDSFTHEGEGSTFTTNMEVGQHEDSRPDYTSTPTYLKNMFRSSVTRNIVNDEKNHSSTTDFVFPAAEDTTDISPSTQQHAVVEHHVSSNQILWYCDGDAASMDTFAASKQLWLSHLGRDASETLVRLQFEDFGPLDQCLFLPAKDFALIEYRNILDAVKAREYMQGSSLWGGCLRIKFLDRGLGSRGAVNGVAVGDSCHVYIGKVFNQWAKDEILHELVRVGVRSPRLVTDLTSGNALLLEFWTAEEATTAMEHIRRQRRGPGHSLYTNKNLSLGESTKNKLISGYQLLVRQIDASVTDEELINAFSRFGELTGWYFNRSSGCCWVGFRLHAAADLAKSNLHGARFGPTSIHVEVVKDNPGTSVNNMMLSPSATAIYNSSVNNSRSRISHMDVCHDELKNTSQVPYYSSLTVKHENIYDHVSPRGKLGNVRHLESDHSFPSNWAATRSSEVLDVGLRKADGIGNSTSSGRSYTEGLTTSHGAERLWQNEKQEIGHETMSQGSLQHSSITAHNSSKIPPPISGPSFVRPLYLTKSSSWDSHALSPSMSLNQSRISNSDYHVNPYPGAPFIPSSVTPFSQLPGGSMQGLKVPGLASAASPSPRSFVVPPPFPSPPPMPPSYPPSLPPLPSSPPPSVNTCLYKWQGSLSKSGVHYSNVYAIREDSAACRYSNSMTEPVDWPARLDVTKRTSVQHVKTTFSNTAPNKREVCLLLPSVASDQKGFHDFMSYLKQRDCAGVIKIPAGKGIIWGRLLFILPYSLDTCSLLAIRPRTAECLIALILPKEANSEGV